MKITALILALLIVVCSSAPRPQIIPESDAEVTVKSEPPKPGSNILPIEFGSVVGEIMVDSGSIGVNPKSKKKEEGPSFSPFISDAGVSFSVGKTDERQEKRPPKEVNGATVVFNNEAAIVEIS